MTTSLSRPLNSAPGGLCRASVAHFTGRCREVAVYNRDGSALHVGAEGREENARLSLLDDISLEIH